ncbi:MAG: hypothetical protein ABJ275_03260 [Maricaulaceae bacterium]
MNNISDTDLKAEILHRRQASYIRLNGGFPIPLAGALYWLILGISGYYLNLANWAQLAFFGSGAIFPIALLFAKIFKNNFMKDKGIVDSVLLPTFISMLLFWPIMIAAVKTEPELVTIILAIGMSLHWPVIGWSYGRATLFSAHSIIRAVIVLYLWLAFPEARLTWLPFSVAIIYTLTVIALLFDVKYLSSIAKRNIRNLS